MGNDKTAIVQNGNQVPTADEIRSKALGKLNKSAREALDAKVENNMKKRVTHEQSIKQIDAEINADIDTFLAGL